MSCSNLESLPTSILLDIVRNLRLSDLFSLSLASRRVRNVVSDPQHRLLNVEAVIYWHVGSQDQRRLPFDIYALTLRHFSPTVGDLKQMLDFLWTRDFIFDDLYNHILSELPCLKRAPTPRKQRMYAQITPPPWPSPTFSPNQLLRKVIEHHD